MSMNKGISIALVAGGVALLVYGLKASRAIESDFSRFFTGAPTDKAVWMLIGGAVATLVGLSGLLRRGN